MNKHEECESCQDCNHWFYLGEIERGVCDNCQEGRDIMEDYYKDWGPFMDEAWL